MNRLRRELRARSNSEAVRLAIDRELAITGIQDALRGLRERGRLEDVFRRAPSRPRRSSALKAARRAEAGGVRSEKTFLKPLKSSTR